MSVLNGLPGRGMGNLALKANTGTASWRTSALQNPGDSTDDTAPYVLLVKDALVAVAGDTAFSVRPDRPSPAR